MFILFCFVLLFNISCEKSALNENNNFLKSALQYKEKNKVSKKISKKEGDDFVALLSGEREASAINNIYVSGLFQRGIRIFKKSKTSLALSPRGFLSSVILVNKQRQSIAIPIKETLTVDFYKIEPSKVNHIKEGKSSGFNLYLIAKKGGLEPKLTLVPKHSSLILPDKYVFASRPLWWVRAVKKNGVLGIVNFTDFGDGVNHYFYKPYALKDRTIPLQAAQNKQLKINGVWEKGPVNARYFLLDITVILKTKLPSNARLKIFLNRGFKNGKEVDFLIETILIGAMTQSNVYRQSLKIPALPNFSQKKLSDVFVEVTGVPKALKKSDAYMYMYVKGWKRVSAFQ